LDIIPEKYQKCVREKILKYLDIMNAEEEREIENWSMVEFIALPGTELASEKLSKLMNEKIKSR
jgi:hypothetical protein